MADEITLLDRLTGNFDPFSTITRVNGSLLTAALYEWALGYETKANIMAAFAIPAGGAQETQLDWLKTQYTNSTDKPDFLLQLRNILLLAESRYFALNHTDTITTRITAIP
jgi:hypothetical protein